jgi:hypothetical protein
LYQQFINGGKKMDAAERRRQIITEEQERKKRHVEGHNKWLERKGYNFKLISYSAPDFLGTEKDNEEMIQSLKLVADDTAEVFKSRKRINKPDQETVDFFAGLGFGLKEMLSKS